MLTRVPRDGPKGRKGKKAQCTVALGYGPRRHLGFCLRDLKISAVLPLLGACVRATQVGDLETSLGSVAWTVWRSQLAFHSADVVRVMHLGFQHGAGRENVVRVMMWPAQWHPFLHLCCLSRDGRQWTVTGSPCQRPDGPGLVGWWRLLRDGLVPVLKASSRPEPVICTRGLVP